MSPRMQYGAAKTIVTSMREGELLYVRKQYVPTLYQMARRLGIGLIIRPTRRNGIDLFSIKKVNMHSALVTGRNGWASDFIAA